MRRSRVSVFPCEYFLKLIFQNSSLSLAFWHQYHFAKTIISLQFIHLVTTNDVPEKNNARVFGSTCPLVFQKKNGCSENFWKLSNKTSIVKSFFLLVPAPVAKYSTTDVVAGIFQKFKNTRIFSLKVCYLLKTNSIIVFFLKISQNF